MHQICLRLTWEAVQLIFVTKRGLGTTFSMIAICEQSPTASFFPLLAVFGGSKSWLRMDNNYIWKGFACNTVSSSIEKAFKLPPTQQFQVMWPRLLYSFQVVVKRFAVRDWRVSL
jgi:hypothetical protein